MSVNDWTTTHEDERTTESTNDMSMGEKEQNEGAVCIDIRLDKIR